MSEENKKSSKSDMAFVAPVVRKDYPIFMSASLDKKKKKSTRQKDPKQSSSGTLSGATQPDGRRREHQKDRRTRRFPKKKTKIVLRKISEINEENEEELLFDEIQQGFTRLRRLTECSEPEEEDEVERPQPTPERAHKKKLFGLFVWRPFSFRKKSQRPENSTST